MSGKKGRCAPRGTRRTTSGKTPPRRWGQMDGREDGDVGDTSPKVGGEDKKGASQPRAGLHPGAGGSSTPAGGLRQGQAASGYELRKKQNGNWFSGAKLRTRIRAVRSLLGSLTRVALATTTFPEPAWDNSASIANVGCPARGGQFDEEPACALRPKAIGGVEAGLRPGETTGVRGPGPARFPGGGAGGYQGGQGRVEARRGLFAAPQALPNSSGWVGTRGLHLWPGTW